jgi:hypothetical protein
MAWAIVIAAGPESRMIATAPRPAGVAGATIVSDAYIRGKR